ncbi:serine/threonine protein kinase [Falsiroseomonas sp.]|uniref:serine/threonine protein kinase n=1 Tax=Falsiroseomonas sp. TaxID=2870721 RepID=UPI00356ABC4F
MERTRLGKYEIRGRLGSGASNVHDGWDPVIERRVAIKVMPRAGAPEADPTRIERGAQLLGSLAHPNVVGVFDSGETEGSAYIVMEFVQGGSLAERLARARPTPQQALRWMDDLLAGLQHCHERGVIHGALDPAKVMLTADERAKIAEPGVARVVADDVTATRQEPDALAYLAPERLTGGTADVRTDIYAAGVLLYEMLTGERPFQGDSIAGVTQRVLQGHPPSPSALSVTAPAALDAVVARAMARDPADRFASAADFARALQAASQAEEATTILAAPQPPHRRRGTAAALLVAVLLAAGGGALYLLWPQPSPPPTEVAELTLPPAAPTPSAPPRTPSPEMPLRPEAPSPPAQAPEAAAPAAPEATPPEAAPREPAAREPVAPPAAPSPPSPEQRITPLPPPARELAEPAPQPPARAPLPREETRRAVRDAIATVPCALVSGDIAEDGNTLLLTGLAASGETEAELRTVVTSAAPSAALDWRVRSFEGPYCAALELVRPISPRFGMLGTGLSLSLAGGRTTLTDGDRLIVDITAPNFPAFLQLSYFQGDGTVFHMQPSAAAPARRYEPLARDRWGEPGPTMAEPPTVGPPFGTDLILGVASESPLFSRTRPETETAEAYLRDLQAAIEAARRRREVLAGTAVPLTVRPRP